MAINIFSGSAPGKQNKNVNAASSSTRAKQAKAALTTPSETSASGSTAVGTTNTLSKVGNFIGKAAGIASKFLPGIGGTIAKGISSLFNDPEWWQQVPGDAITLNEPLRILKHGEAPTKTSAKVSNYSFRAAILEIKSKAASGSFPAIIQPTNNQVNQYLLPQVRKVVNAIPLQDNSAYSTALQSATAIYAMWRDLKKFDYMCKHGQTYMASMNDNAFPLFKTENAAWLQSTINRLEEYLRANIRLPHTMCEYLSWRFGRVYKTNNSAKAGLVIYSTMGIEALPADWDAAIAAAMEAVSSNTEVSHANTDLYNAYYDHDYMVEVRDDTQFRYDTKEFMLRCNTQVHSELSQTFVVIDSNLDNPTTFMASTVSSIGQDQDGTFVSLFPIDRYRVYIPTAIGNNLPDVLVGIGDIKNYSGTGIANVKAGYSGVTPNGSYSKVWAYVDVEANTSISSIVMPSGQPGGTNVTKEQAAGVNSFLVQLMAAKSVDLYNVGLYVPMMTIKDTTWSDAGRIDMTSLSIDAGNPTFTTIATEQVYAFANLVDMERKHSMSYKQAEKLVARDTAELVDKLDVAAVKS